MMQRILIRMHPGTEALFYIPSFFYYVLLRSS